MNRSNIETFLTKLFIMGGVVMFLLTEIIIVAAYRHNRFPSFSYVDCFIVFMPLLVGTKGFFSVKRFMSASKESNTKALKTLAHLFSFGIVAAYGALIAVITPLFTLHP